VLAPSSIGLQPWKFFVVTDQAVKARLVPASFNQAQAGDCSHFVVFTVRKALDAGHVDRHVARMAEVQGVTTESLEKFKQMTVGNLEKARAEGKLDTWQTHQIYIALGQFMASAALLGVDTCPMEGIAPDQFDAILGLNGTNYTTVVACAAGYRRADDKYATTKMVKMALSATIKQVMPTTPLEGARASSDSRATVADSGWKSAVAVAEFMVCGSNLDIATGARTFLSAATSELRFGLGNWCAAPAAGACCGQECPRSVCRLSSFVFPIGISRVFDVPKRPATFDCGNFSEVVFRRR